MKDVRKAVVDNITAAAKDFLEGAKEDVQEFGRKIAQDCLLLAAEPKKSKREAGLRENRAQMRVLADIQRVRGTKLAWAVFEHTTAVVVRMASAALLA
jgi:hypothetical protein